MLHKWGNKTYIKFWLESLKRRPKCRLGMEHMDIKLEGMDWIHPAQDRDHWWVLMSTAMNLWVHFGREFLD
jgi:hypothetical protein